MNKFTCDFRRFLGDPDSFLACEPFSSQKLSIKSVQYLNRLICHIIVRPQGEREVKAFIEKICNKDYSIVGKIAWDIIFDTKAKDPRLFSLLYPLLKPSFSDNIMTKHTLEIVIPTFNRDLSLSKVLRQIASYNIKPITARVIDNNSEDDTETMISSLQGELKTLDIVYKKNPTNIGPIKNQFVALNEVKSECVLFCTDDDVVPELLIAYSLVFFRLNPEHGLLYFDDRHWAESFYPRKRYHEALQPSFESYQILKAVNTLGGLALSARAINRCLPDYNLESSLISHCKFALAIAKFYPVAAIHHQSFMPGINEVEGSKSSRPINTSLNLSNIYTMMRDGSFDHSFLADGWTKHGLQVVLYLQAYVSPGKELASDQISLHFLSTINPWYGSWLKSRLLTLSDLKTVNGDLLLTIYRMLQVRFSSNIIILSSLACIFDSITNQLSVEAEDLFRSFIGSVLLNKFLIEEESVVDSSDSARLRSLIFYSARALLLGECREAECVSMITENMHDADYFLLNYEPINQGPDPVLLKYGIASTGPCVNLVSNLLAKRLTEGRLGVINFIIVEVLCSQSPAYPFITATEASAMASTYSNLIRSTLREVKWSLEKSDLGSS